VQHLELVTVTGGEYLGLYPAYTLGTTADRNHVVTRNFGRLR
jgi:Icc protein